MKDLSAVRGRAADRIRWGAGSKLAAEIVGRALQFVLVYAAQRTLGPAMYGELTYALAMGLVPVSLTDLGIQLIVTREMARDSSRVADIAGTGLSLKLVLSCAVVAIIAGMSLTRPSGVQAATFLLALSMVFSSLSEFFGYTFRGLHRVEHEAVLNLAVRTVTVALGLWVLFHGGALAGLALAYAIASAIGAASGYLWLRWRFFAPRLSADAKAWRSLLGQTLPIGGAIVLSIAFTRTPVFLLDGMLGVTAVGMYGVAQKLTEPWAMIPAAVMAAAFPAFAQGASAGATGFQWLRSRVVTWLGMMGAGLALAGWVGGPWLMELLYGGQYAGAERPLQILALALVLTFVNYALTHLLIALDLQHLNLRFTAIMFAVNLGLCWWLIPTFGPAGAAGAALVSEAVLFALAWRALQAASRRVPTVLESVSAPTSQGLYP